MTLRRARNAMRPAPHSRFSCIDPASNNLGSGFMLSTIESFCNAYLEQT
jgi:hypothetical protein